MKRQQKWYAAHVLIAIKYRRGAQRTFPVYENIVIFRGRDADEVRHKAEQLALSESVSDDSVTLGGRPARLVFVGVRKVVECQDSTARAIKYPKSFLPPGDGTEVTYSMFTVTGANGLAALAEGKKVVVRYDAD